jgi:hypothetical protein
MKVIAKLLLTHYATSTVIHAADLKHKLRGTTPKNMALEEDIAFWTNLQRNMQYMSLPDLSSVNPDATDLAPSLERTSLPTPSPVSDDDLTVVSTTAATALLLEDTYQPIWFAREEGWNGQTWNEADAFCKSNDARLCPYEVYCPTGPNHLPYGGVRPESVVWAPISDSNNGWVSVSGQNTCVRYDILYLVSPSWGITGEDNEDKTRHIMCCKDPNSAVTANNSDSSVTESEIDLAPSLEKTSLPTPSPVSDDDDLTVVSTTAATTLLVEDTYTPTPAPQQNTLIPTFTIVNITTSPTIAFEATPFPTGVMERKNHFLCPPAAFVGCTDPNPILSDECDIVGEECGDGMYCCRDNCPRNYCTAKGVQ